MSSAAVNNAPNYDLLQAEGELNNDIQAALKNFREKLVDNVGQKKDAPHKHNEQK